MLSWQPWWQMLRAEPRPDPWKTDCRRDFSSLSRPPAYSWRAVQNTHFGNGGDGGFHLASACFAGRGGPPGDDRCGPCGGTTRRRSIKCRNVPCAAIGRIRAPCCRALVCSIANAGKACLPGPRLSADRWTLDTSGSLDVRLELDAGRPEHVGRRIRPRQILRQHHGR